MGKFNAILGGIFFAALLLFSSAGAQNLIPPTESQGPVPTFGGTGLFGVYYDNGSGFSSAAGSQAEASFTTSNLCFPDCLGGGFNDGTGGLQAFTNGNATNFNFFTSVEPVRLTWDSSEIVMSGYIAITTPGTYTFNLGRDDFVSFTLGGVTQQFGCCGTDVVQDTFTQPGLYAISVQFIENGGGSVLSLTGLDPNNNCILGCYDANNNLAQNDLFYSDADLSGAPAPVIGGGWAAIALLGLAALRRRRLPA